MKRLSDIINERDIKFKDLTMEIFQIMDLSIECVEEFLGGNDPMFDIGYFSWNDVFLEEGLVTILGIVSFDDGTVVETDEGTVNITSDNIEYFERVVRMVLPYELVASGNKEEIMDFLQQLQTSGKGDDFNDIIKNAPEPQVDFDLSDLSEEQRESLLLYTNKLTNN